MPEKSVHSPERATIAAGIPEINGSLDWRIGFCVGGPVAPVELPTPGGTRSVPILHGIEMQRARTKAKVDEMACPADYAPPGGLSGDRETATAQAAAKCLRRADTSHCAEPEEDPGSHW